MKHDILIFYADIHPLASEEVFTQQIQTVNEQRRKKILRCSHKKDQMRSLGAGLLLRLALEEQGFDYEALSFEVDDKGKGYIKDRSDVFYSITHGGDFVAVVVGKHQVGIDVESGIRFTGERGNKTIERVSRYSFSNEERFLLSDVPQKLATTFATIWTRKEAYTKALGCGISTDLKMVSTQGKQFLSYNLDENHICSVYCENVSAMENVNFIAIDFEK